MDFFLGVQLHYAINPIFNLYVLTFLFYCDKNFLYNNLITLYNERLTIKSQAQNARNGEKSRRFKKGMAKQTSC